MNAEQAAYWRKPGPIAAAKARAAAKAQERVQDSKKATMKPGPPAPNTRSTR